MIPGSFSAASRRRALDIGTRARAESGLSAALPAGCRRYAAASARPSRAGGDVVDRRRWPHGRAARRRQQRGGALIAGLGKTRRPMSPGRGGHCRRTAHRYAGARDEQADANLYDPRWTPAVLLAARTRAQVVWEHGPTKSARVSVRPRPRTRGAPRGRGPNDARRRARRHVSAARDEHRPTGLPANPTRGASVVR